MEHLNKIRIRSFQIIVVLMATFVSSCYYDNEEELYPATADCETQNMSYSQDIWPIISSTCTGCHSGASPAGDVPLENYADISSSGAIDPGNYGSLYGTISHASGNSPMPKNGDKLSDCTISKIKAWIDQGSPDN